MEGHLKMDADLASQVLDVEEQLIVAEMRRRTEIGGLNAAEISIAPVRLVVKPHLSIETLYFDLCKGDDCIIDEVMIKLGHLAQQILSNFEDIDATMYGNPALLDFPE